MVERGAGGQDSPSWRKNTQNVVLESDLCCKTEGQSRLETEGWGDSAGRRANLSGQGELPIIVEAPCKHMASLRQRKAAVRAARKVQHLRRECHITEISSLAVHPHAARMILTILYVALLLVYWLCDAARPGCAVLQGPGDDPCFLGAVLLDQILFSQCMLGQAKDPVRLKPFQGCRTNPAEQNDDA